MEAPSGCRWYYVFLKVSISLHEGKPVYHLDIPVVRAEVYFTYRLLLDWGQLPALAVVCSVKAEVYFTYHLLPDCGQLPALAVVCSPWAYVFV